MSEDEKVEGLIAYEDVKEAGGTVVPFKEETAVDEVGKDETKGWGEELYEGEETALVATFPLEIKALEADGDFIIPFDWRGEISCCEGPSSSSCHEGRWGIGSCTKGNPPVSGFRDKTRLKQSPAEAINGTVRQQSKSWVCVSFTWKIHKCDISINDLYMLSSVKLIMIIKVLKEK